jgi:hypothetical protein
LTSVAQHATIAQSMLQILLVCALPPLVVAVLIWVVRSSQEQKRRQAERHDTELANAATALARRLGLHTDKGRTVCGKLGAHTVEIEVSVLGCRASVDFLRSPLPADMSMRARRGLAWDHHRYEDYGTDVTGDAQFDELYAAAPIAAARAWSPSLRAAFVAHHVDGAEIGAERVTASFWSQPCDEAACVELLQRLLALVTAVEQIAVG